MTKREPTTSIEVCAPLHRFRNSDEDGDGLTIRFHARTIDLFSFATYDAGGDSIITHLTHDQVRDLISFLQERLSA